MPVHQRAAEGWERRESTSVYHAGTFWKALRALERQVNPAPWLLHGTDVIWLCIKASAFSSFVQLRNDITPKHKEVPLCWGPSPAGPMSHPTAGCVPLSLPRPGTLPRSPRSARHLCGAGRASGSLQAPAACARSQQLPSKPCSAALQLLQVHSNLSAADQLSHTGQLRRFNYFQGWKPLGGMYNGTRCNKLCTCYSTQLL